jgi:hypothetical protein
MDPIYVEIRPTYPSNAKKAPAEYMAKAKAKIEATAKKKLTQASGFTFNEKDAKRASFIVRVNVTEIIVSANQVTVKMSAEIMKPPDFMVSTTSPTAQAAVQSKVSEAAVMDAVEAAVENLMGKVGPAMKRAADS